MLDEQIKNKFGTWKYFSNAQKENPKNFKRKILQNIERLNKWVLPAELQIKIIKINDTMETLYLEINPLDCFIIKDEFGEASFMKRHNHKAICLSSSEATYEKNREYYIQDEQRVIKTGL